MIVPRSISDARLAFTILEGTAIVFGFGTKEEVGKWVKMRLPKSQEIEEEVKALRMEAIGIGDNFMFV